LQDSAFNLPQFLGSVLGERLGRGTAAAYATGTGTAQPNGLVTAATLGVTAASATAIADTELIDLVHSVDIAYRNQPGAGWVMNDAIVKAIRKLKDSDNQFIWQPGLTVAEPDRLLGFPIQVDQQMSSALTAGQKVALFGALRKYVIRDVLGVTLTRLVERYAEFHQQAFVAIMRTDADLLDAGTNPVKYLLLAAS